MTQDYILVSPTPSACLKPGNSSDLRLSLGLRHSSAGDTHSSITALPRARGCVCPHFAFCTLHFALVRPSLGLRPSDLGDTAAPTAIRPSPQKKCALFSVSSVSGPLCPLCYSAPLFLRKYLITSLFSAAQPRIARSTLNPQRSTL